MVARWGCTELGRFGWSMVDQWRVLSLSATCLAAAACGSAPVAAPAPTRTPVPVGSVMVDGSVERPTLFSVADLAALPAHSLDVSFGTHAGTQHHVEARPRLGPIPAKVAP